MLAAPSILAQAAIVVTAVICGICRISVLTTAAGIASATIIRGIRGSSIRGPATPVRGTGTLRCGAGFLQRSLQVQALGDQFAGGTGTQFHALDVLRHGEDVLAHGTAVVLDAEREDGEVGNLHVLALQQQFLDARHHVREYPFDGTLRVRCVVVRHVFGQCIQVDGLLDHGEGKPFPERRRLPRKI